MKKIKLLFGILGMILVLLSFVSAHTGDETFGTCMFGGMMGGMGGGFFMWILYILVIVGLVLLIAWLIKQIQKK